MGQDNIDDIINKQIYKKGEVILEEVIDKAFKLFCNKIAYGGIIAKNETAFQCEFGNMLKTLGQLYEFQPSDSFSIHYEVPIILKRNSIKSKSQKARIDILIEYKLNEKISKAAIELKYFKKENSRMPNNRYDVFKDLSNLEAYKEEGQSEISYFILLTDDTHYVHNKTYTQATGDFDFRHGATYKSGSILSYRTNKPYGPDLRLTNDYKFLWGQIENLYFLKIKI